MKFYNYKKNTYIYIYVLFLETYPRHTHHVRFATAERMKDIQQRATLSENHVLHGCIRSAHQPCPPSPHNAGPDDKER